MSLFMQNIVLLILGAAFAMGGWALLMSVNHESRISVVESRYFTQADALRMKEDIIGAIHEVKECLIKHQSDQPCQ